MKPFCLLLVLAFVANSASQLVAADSARPNILYFYVDDMGWGSIGPNGQAERKRNGLPYVRTPNLDALARGGINFVRGYGCHVCSPARSSQQSGFHQGHTFADRNDPNNAKKAMRAADILMGDALSAAGYTTGYWGKWGYGGSKDQANPVIENVQTLPTSHGYQHVLAELHHVRAHTFFQPTLWSAPAKAGAIGGLQLVPNSMNAYQNNAAYPNTPALQNHADYPKVAYCDDAYAFAALDFVRTQSQQYNQSGQPFFGLLAVQIPHAPFGEIESLPEWNQTYKNDKQFQSLADQTRQWAAMVTRIDAHFGNILAALEDPNNDGDKSDSVAENTLVVFQSDNGGPAGKNNIELNANGGLRGNKGKIQEGGIRVPLVMRWPAHIHSRSELKVGTDSRMIVDVTDLMPTFCELAGTTPPLGVDGVSIAPMLQGRPADQRHRQFIIHEAGNGQSIISGDHKLVRSKKAAPQLYDLEKDRAEENDISGDHPKLVKEMLQLLLEERVDEPKGFANTYHHWTGKNNAALSEADNWSDYEYSNAGVTYMTDDGAPQLSWVARIENTSNKPNTARADKAHEFLGLEVTGRDHQATQSLVVGADTKVVGRNEIRVGAHGSLNLVGGTISSLRWIDILPQGRLAGSGSVDATVYNQGSVSSISQPGISIRGDYVQSKQAALKLSILTALQITGTARLDGTLSVQVDKLQKVAGGREYTVLTADNVTGTFGNSKRLVASDGTKLKVRYTGTSVLVSVAD